jgi:hypothetical protein
MNAIEFHHGDTEAPRRMGSGLAVARHVRSLTERYGEEDLVRGRVMLREGQRVSVTLDEGGEMVARRAASCLLAPEVGDRVLVAVGEESFVLAVLTRDESAPSRVVFDGDTRLEVPGGRLDLAAEGGVGITTPRALSLFAQRIAARSAIGELFVDSVDLVAKSARTQVDKLSLVATTYDAVVERIAERSKRVYRFVEEIDRLRARHLDYRAEKTAQLTADNTAVTARQVAKLDGEQVHIG